MMDSKRRRLRQKLAAGEFIAAPGVFDLISARIADHMRFPALYMTGYGVVASSLGLPDAGLAGYSDMVERVGRIASATDTPLIADADTGYGVCSTSIIPCMVTNRPVPAGYSWKTNCHRKSAAIHPVAG